MSPAVKDNSGRLHGLTILKSPTAVYPRDAGKQVHKRRRGTRRI